MFTRESTVKGAVHKLATFAHHEINVTTEDRTDGYVCSGAGMTCWQSAGLVIERLRVRIPAGAMGIFSPELPLYADSYSVSVTLRCYRSGTKKTPVILPTVQVAGYT